jgi:hypothetical protein
MEIKFTQGDTVAIPAGCTATIKDGVITFTPQQDFKDGDILIDDVKPNHDDTHKIMMIYKGSKDFVGAYRCYIHRDLSGILIKDDSCCNMDNCKIRLATEEEKQELFDLMKEKGLRWNAAEKRIEKIRWRAEDGEEYCYVGNQGIIMVDREDGHCADKNRHEFGNYFRTREQALAAANAIKELLIRIHDENTD